MYFSLFRNRYEVIAYARRKNTVAKNNTSSVTMTLTMKEAETMYEFQFGCLYVLIIIVVIVNNIQ